MKKFYTLALGALIALTTSAAPAVTLKTGPVNKKAEFSKVVEAALTEAEVAGKANLDFTKPAKAPAKLTAAELEGDYIYLLGDYYWDESVGEIVEEGSISVNGTTVTFDCNYFPTSVTGTADATYTNIKFEEKYIGPIELVSGSTGYLKFEPFKYTQISEDDSSIDAASFSITFDGQKFTAPAGYGFSWPVYSDEACTQLLGRLDMFDVLSVLPKSAVWTDCGNGEFVDNIMAPFFGVNVTEPSEVKIYKSKTEENYFQVMDPWKALYSALGAVNESPSIYLDASDPTNVTIEMTSTGINGGAQVGVLYLMSLNYYNNLGKADTPDEYKITYTEAEGVGTFTFPYRSCRVYAATQKQLYYAINDAAGTKITFNLPAEAGAGLVEADEADAPVKYYNLQGVEVAAPAAGQFVIRVQGDKATKMVVR